MERSRRRGRGVTAGGRPLRVRRLVCETNPKLLLGSDTSARGTYESFSATHEIADGGRGIEVPAITVRDVDKAAIVAPNAGLSNFNDGFVSDSESFRSNGG